jgi:hypothetical protein
MMRWDCKDIDRDAIIHELMLEAGLTDAPELTDSLKALDSFASMPAPVPGPALAAMLAGTDAGAGTAAEAGTALGAGGTGAAELIGAGNSADNLRVDELGKRRQLRKHRPTVIGAAVLTAMGLGVGGVAAASGGFSKETPDFMQALISGWAPGWTTAPPSLVPPAPTRDSPKVTTHPAPVDPPAPPVAEDPVGTAAPQVAVPSVVQPSADAVVPSPADPAEVKGPTKQGTAGQSAAPKTGRAEPKTASQGVLKQTTDTLPKWIGKDVPDGLKQVLQNSADGLGAQSPGASFRWPFGLNR